MVQNHEITNDVIAGSNKIEMLMAMDPRICRDVQSSSQSSS